MKKIFILSSILFINIAIAQTTKIQGISRDYFRFPLDIPMSLAANFGECRTDHFHMGLDIRTNQKENYPVYAAADGYVYRIYINKNGFGRAIYIRHPNGYTTVYGHLNKFFSALQQYVEQKQYAEQQWEQDFTLTPNQFRIYKSQFIANSGNTGFSEGPHLHFEIRETKTDVNINPMWFIDVPDNIKPTITQLAWYDRSGSIYQQNPSFIKIKKTSEGYSSVDSVVEIPASNIFFGIIASDKSNTSSFHYGIYKARLEADSNIISEFKLDSISYNDTRYINASIDYAYKKQTKKYIQYLFPLPGNHLSYFTNLKNNGVINISDDSIHKINILVEDFNGNNQIINLKIKRKIPEQVFPRSSEMITPNDSWQINESDIKVVFPKNAVYDDVYSMLSKTTSYNNNVVSAIFSLRSPSIPLHTNINIHIKPNRVLNTIEKDKVVAQYLSDKKPIAIKPEWEKDWAKLTYNSLGDFNLIIDTVAPVINIQGITDSSNISRTKRITIKAIDTEGGIQHFNAILDGQWLMFARKGDYFIYDLDDHCSPGYHTLICSVEDIVGNVAEKTISFFRDDDAVKRPLLPEVSGPPKERNKKKK